MDQIKKATESVSKNSVEQTAYFRALGKFNNLDMDKFRNQVEKELRGSVDDKKTGNVFLKKEIKSWFILLNYFFEIWKFILFYRVIFSALATEVHSDVSAATSDVQPNCDSTNEPDTGKMDKIYDGDSFEGDGLPEIENKNAPRLPFENDHIFGDDAATVTMTDSEEDSSEPYVTHWLGGTRFPNINRTNRGALCWWQDTYFTGGHGRNTP